jgi:hypothetical protein
VSYPNCYLTVITLTLQVELTTNSGLSGTTPEECVDLSDGGGRCAIFEGGHVGSGGQNYRFLGGEFGAIKFEINEREGID